MKKLLTRLTLLAKDIKSWLAFIAGLILTFSYSPFEIWPIAFISIAAVIFVLIQTIPEKPMRRMPLNMVLYLV